MENNCDNICLKLDFTDVYDLQLESVFRYSYALIKDDNYIQFVFTNASFHDNEKICCALSINKVNHPYVIIILYQICNFLLQTSEARYFQEH